MKHGNAVVIENINNFECGDAMAPNRTYQEMGKLDLTEKPRFVEDIWDSIARSKAELPLPE